MDEAGWGEYLVGFDSSGVAGSVLASRALFSLVSCNHLVVPAFQTLSQ
jgi:hypothetical protein